MRTVASRERERNLIIFIRFNFPFALSMYAVASVFEFRCIFRRFPIALHISKNRYLPSKILFNFSRRIERDKLIFSLYVPSRQFNVIIFLGKIDTDSIEKISEILLLLKMFHIFSNFVFHLYIYIYIQIFRRDKHMIHKKIIEKQLFRLPSNGKCENSIKIDRFPAPCEHLEI